MSNGLILGSVVRTTLLNDLSGEASGPSWEGFSPTFPRQKIKCHPIRSLKQYRRYFNRAIFLAHVPIPLQDGKVGRKKEFTGGRVYFTWWWHGRRERSLIHDSYMQVLVPSSKSSGSPLEALYAEVYGWSRSTVSSLGLARALLTAFHLGAHRITYPRRSGCVCHLISIRSVPTVATPL